MSSTAETPVDTAGPSGGDGSGAPLPEGNSQPQHEKETLLTPHQRSIHVRFASSFLARMPHHYLALDAGRMTAVGEMLQQVMNSTRFILSPVPDSLCCGVLPVASSKKSGGRLVQRHHRVGVFAANRDIFR